MPSLHGGYLCVSSFLCSPLFASSLLPRPVQLALLRRGLRLRLRHRSPAPSTSSSSRRYFVRSWQATARPRVSGSAVSRSATPIASDVIVLSADPFGSQSPPLGNLGRVLFSPTAQARLGWRFGRFRSLAPHSVVGDDWRPRCDRDNCFVDALMASPASCSAGRSAGPNGPRWLAPIIPSGSGQCGRRYNGIASLHNAHGVLSEPGSIRGLFGLASRGTTEGSEVVARCVSPVVQYLRGAGAMDP